MYAHEFPLSAATIPEESGRLILAGLSDKRVGGPVSLDRGNERKECADG